MISEGNFVSDKKGNLGHLFSQFQKNCWVQRGKKKRGESWSLDLQRMFISYVCMMRKGLALGRRGRKRTEAFYWGHLIDFWGRIFAFVLWCLYTYSVLLIINGCLSHISTWWGKDGLWAGEEGRGRGQGPADFRKSRWSVSFILGPLHSLIIYISLPGERINIV